MVREGATSGAYDHPIHTHIVHFILLAGSDLQVASKMLATILLADFFARARVDPGHQVQCCDSRHWWPFLHGDQAGQTAFYGVW